MFIRNQYRKRSMLEGGEEAYFPLGFPLQPRPLKPRFPDPDPAREPEGLPMAAPLTGVPPRRRDPWVRR